MVRIHSPRPLFLRKSVEFSLVEHSVQPECPAPRIRLARVSPDRTVRNLPRRQLTASNSIESRRQIATLDTTLGTKTISRAACAFCSSIGTSCSIGRSKPLAAMYRTPSGKRRPPSMADARPGLPANFRRRDDRVDSARCAGPDAPARSFRESRCVQKHCRVSMLLGIGSSQRRRLRRGRTGELLPAASHLGRAAQKLDQSPLGK